MIRFYKKFFRHQYPGLLMWMVTLGVWARFVSKVVLYAVSRLRTTQHKRALSAITDNTPAHSFNVTRISFAEGKQKLAREARANPGAECKVANLG
jgi:hypothetical protein